MPPREVAADERRCDAVHISMTRCLHCVALMLSLFLFLVSKKPESHGLAEGKAILGRITQRPECAPDPVRVITPLFFLEQMVFCALITGVTAAEV